MIIKLEHTRGPKGEFGVHSSSEPPHVTRRGLKYAAAIAALVALWFTGPRAVERFAPWVRIAAQVLAARVPVALGTDAVLLIGDSRMAALGERALERPGARVFNLGLSGSTAEQWRTFVERASMPPRATTVIWLGVNDVWHWDATAQAVADNLRRIAGVLASGGHRVILIDQIPATGSVTPVYQRINRISRAINAQFDAVPPHARVLPIADLFEKAVETGSTSRLYDGIHLTAEANEQVWQRIANAIQTQTAHQ